MSVIQVSAASLDYNTYKTEQEQGLEPPLEVKMSSHLFQWAMADRK